ncbi:MAG TPA: ParB N-terminal domain-containing protein [Kiritimatiellia bacterium]|nr:ParB N-terminal domain-containing protein [Kiritimatiellia bacterium]HMO98932.1 ParB N-terminal domain-containing protein [Kiritimatiellia bacterium]HMP95735.1 ParB N-terminal domain-containing protein [Kiritimatiellia bacterium]
MTHPEPAPSRLGRGLTSMIGEVAGIKAGGSAAPGAGFLRIPLAEIPLAPDVRKPDAALIQSVKAVGVLQPILVARSDSGYAVLAGARRLIAAREAGLADIPAIIIPPDRAGPLDVFLDENLTRAELTETERIALRERYQRETGRDQEQAESRIPEVQWESTTPSLPVKTPRIWMTAAGVLAAVSTILLIMVFNAKPIDRRPVIIPVEFSEAPPPAAPDTTWMEAFAFPGHIREETPDGLLVIVRDTLSEADALPESARTALHQLAALLASSEQPLRAQVRLLGPATQAHLDAARAIVHGEGMSQRITITPPPRANRTGPAAFILIQIRPETLAAQAL